MADGVGKYLKPLLISSMVYTLIGMSYSGSAAWITPPPELGWGTVKWLFSTVMSLVWNAFTVMSFPMVPDPLRFLLTLVFGSMFVYGLVGLIYHLVKLVKPFG